MRDRDDNNNDGDQPDHVEIPMDRLSRDVLLAIIEEFVLREGTDYGYTEVPHDIKRGQVLAQLRADKAMIVFDPATETCTILMRE